MKYVIVKSVQTNTLEVVNVDHITNVSVGANQHCHLHFLNNRVAVVKITMEDLIKLLYHVGHEVYDLEQLQNSGSLSLPAPKPITIQKVAR